MSCSSSPSSGLQVLLAVPLALAGTLAAGDLSAELAGRLVSAGVQVPLREPLNLLMVLVVGWLAFGSLGPPTVIRLGQAGPGVLVGAVMALGVLLGAWGLLIATGAASSPRWIGDSTTPVALAVFALPWMVLHGLSEQYLVHRLAQDRAERWRGAWAGILVAALVWTVAQALQGYVAPVLLVNSFLLGCLFGLVARGPGGVLAAGLAHGLWSWLETVVWRSLWQWNLEPGAGAVRDQDSYGTWALTLVLLAVLLVAVWRERRAQATR